MVLLLKEEKPAGTPSEYRPICLLDEADKLFERIIVARLRQHLSRTGPDLADCQYGFREARSTIDAIKRVKTLSETAVSRGRKVLAVSLDIANAFNSFPWDHIKGALEYHRVPSGSRLWPVRVHPGGRSRATPGGKHKNDGQKHYNNDD
jgi:hypothetical protein